MKIAAGQISCIVGDVAANTAKLVETAGRARAAGAEWVVFPEMSDTGYTMAAIRQHASEWTVGAVPELQRIASYLSLGIICGVSERADGLIYNTQVVIAPTGEILAKYRKMHLFSPEPVKENSVCSAGDEVVSLQVKGMNIGLGICYDLRFPELWRTLAVDHATSTFAISSAWPFPRVEHLRVLATARAIENQSYVVLANRVGTDWTIPFCGSSCIVDPYGTVIAAASPNREEILVADLKDEVVAEVRGAMPVLEHRGMPSAFSGRRQRNGEKSRSTC
jgi:predicted amidohydrolase